jgi:hypothetical protein
MNSNIWTLVIPRVQGRDTKYAKISDAIHSLHWLLPNVSSNYLQELQVSSNCCRTLRHLLHIVNLLERHGAYVATKYTSLLTAWHT